MHERVAYFSMEIALREEIPTYSGGLGILAGDFLRSAALLHVPIVGVTLLHRKGYFSQSLDGNGLQREAPQVWPVEKFLEEMPQRISLEMEKRTVHVRAWKYDLKGNGRSVPVYLLDTDLPENGEWDRTLTDFLYGGDVYYRLCQEILLGIGGLKMLRALGFESLDRYHMNEGHSSLLTLELLEESARKAGRKVFGQEDVEAVKRSCIFTTHTPVEAGHDQFPWELVHKALGREEIFSMRDLFCCSTRLNMTFLGFNFSRYINGVAKKHGAVSSRLFQNYAIGSITNGVCPITWTAAPFERLYDEHLAGWREDHFHLRHALVIPKEAIWNAHTAAKKELAEYVRSVGEHKALDPECFTIGIGRRATAYKRLDLLFRDVEKLKEISKKAGPLQIVYGGKAHPKDQAGKEMIQAIFAAKKALEGRIRVVYLENYDMRIAKLMVSGTDLWLNTPEPPLEASGTSGMKAALNGVPSLSILDGWWNEGCIEGITGWSIDSPLEEQHLYVQLEKIASLYYQSRDEYIGVMLHAIALNGSFFNTQRMVLQYVLHAYF